jgi:hypothetical protein
VPLQRGQTLPGLPAGPSFCGKFTPTALPSGLWGFAIGGLLLRVAAERLSPGRNRRVVEPTHRIDERATGVGIANDVRTDGTAAQIVAAG